MEALYLLVETDVGALEDVARRLRTIPHVVEVHPVTGPYDLIVKIEAPHINTALEVVVKQVRKIPGIKGTETLVTMGRP
jgi:DNA-binding Lrp family transcriptional regulator